MADTGDAVAAAAYALTVWLAAAEAVTGLPDQAGTGWVSGGWATSAAPGNVAALNVVTDAHEGVRRMEAGLRAAVAGVAWQVRRGGSAGNTAAAIEAVVSLAAGADEGVRAEVAARLDRWTLEARVLPGVDGPPVWTVIRLRGRVVPPCPWCGTPNLRVNRGLGVVACLFPRCPGAGGVRPVAVLGTDARGRVCWTWPGGLVQPRVDAVASARLVAARARVPAAGRRMWPPPRGRVWQTG